MGVISDGNNYGQPDGLIYSFPVVINNGEWKIVDNLEFSDGVDQELKLTADELLGERSIALGI